MDFQLSNHILFLTCRAFDQVDCWCVLEIYAALSEKIHCSNLWFVPKSKAVPFDRYTKCNISNASSRSNRESGYTGRKVWWSFAGVFNNHLCFMHKGNQLHKPHPVKPYSTIVHPCALCIGSNSIATVSYCWNFT